MELTRAEMLRPESSSAPPWRRGLPRRRAGPRSEALSRLRQRSQAIEERRVQLLGTLREPGWMLAGSLVRRRTVCGKAGCRCARGERHGPQQILMVQEGERRRAAVLHPGRDDALWRAHRQYRCHRAALRELKCLERESHGILKAIAAHHRRELPAKGS